ncbi:hypothetical protein P7K49_013122 [Saguinus oedipus]|uniref:Cytokine receptor-like factor 2-like D2 domain-containing protein n=1 Tax=Saguinus oedipus TaxID=9490 RepID=A0ABQ9VF06_SAGOE|nr:hypothetical protein P7K49_013122 [Saguinus oedipus]
MSVIISKERDTCNVTIEGLDAENCYSLQVRVKATQVAYGSDTYPSDWSEVMHWQRGEQMGGYQASFPLGYTDPWPPQAVSEADSLCTLKDSGSEPNLHSHK